MFLLASTAGGLLLDGVAKLLAKLWIYPDWSFWFYALIFVLGFAAYWLTIAESYLATKVVLDYVRKGIKGTRPHIKRYRFLFTILTVVGLLFICFASFMVYGDYLKQSLDIFTKSSVNSNVETLYRVPFMYVLMLFTGTVLFFEGLLYFMKKRSLIQDVLQGYFGSLLAILIASAVLSILMEAQNLPAQLWTYTNWPLEQYALGTLTLLTLVVWPLHYISFLHLFRIITGNQSESVWQGDRIFRKIR